MKLPVEKEQRLDMEHERDRRLMRQDCPGVWPWK